MTPFENLKLQVASMPSAEHSVVQLVAGIAAHVAQTCGEKGAEIASSLRADAHAMAVAVVTRTELDPAIARETEAAKEATPAQPDAARPESLSASINQPMREPAPAP